MVKYIDIMELDPIAQMLGVVSSNKIKASVGKLPEDKRIVIDTSLPLGSEPMLRPYAVHYYANELRKLALKDHSSGINKEIWDSHKQDALKGAAGAIEGMVSERVFTQSGELNLNIKILWDEINGQARLLLDDVPTFRSTAFKKLIDAHDQYYIDNYECKDASKS